MNRVVEKMKFDIVGGYSNMLGGGNLAVSLAVRDVTPSTITACERAQTLFGASACATANVAKTIVKVCDRYVVLATEMRVWGVKFGVEAP